LGGGLLNVFLNLVQKEKVKRSKKGKRVSAKGQFYTVWLKKKQLTKNEREGEGGRSLDIFSTTVES